MKYNRQHYICECGCDFTVEYDNDFKILCPRCGKRIKENNHGTERQVEEHPSSVTIAENV